MCFLTCFALDDDDRLHDVLFATLFGTVSEGLSFN